MIGGVIVGMTSVGSGSLMIVLLLFLYPTLGANQLVGTDLTQAVPLTVAAALGALAFGHVEFAVTVSLIIGSVPAVLVGSLLSSTAPDRYIRPAITFVIFASGLKYVGVGHDRARLDAVRRPTRRSGPVDVHQAAMGEPAGGAAGCAHGATWRARACVGARRGAGALSVRTLRLARASHLYGRTLYPRARLLRDEIGLDEVFAPRFEFVGRLL